MKRYIAMAGIALTAISTAFAIEPYQVGTYLGKFNFTLTDFNTQKPIKQKANAIFILAPDGSAAFMISPGPVFPGEAATGDFHGFFGYSDTNSLGSASLKFANDTVSGQFQVGIKDLDGGASIMGKFKLKKSDMVAPMSHSSQ